MPQSLEPQAHKVRVGQAAIPDLSIPAEGNARTDRDDRSRIKINWTFDRRAARHKFHCKKGNLQTLIDLARHDVRFNRPREPVRSEPLLWPVNGYYRCPSAARGSSGHILTLKGRRETQGRSRYTCVCTCSRMSCDGACACRLSSPELLWNRRSYEKIQWQNDQCIQSREETGRSSTSASSSSSSSRWRSRQRYGRNDAELGLAFPRDSFAR